MSSDGQKSLIALSVRVKHSSSRLTIVVCISSHALFTKGVNHKNMSRKPYECFKCRDSGFPNTFVFLAGKDDQGRTIQLEEDGSKHIHKGKQEQQQEQLKQSSTIVTEPTTTVMKIIEAKLDCIISLLESQKK